MKKLPFGEATFSRLIEDNCVYVDKTKYIYELIQGNCVFFCRPRCFGKSLLCSTLQELFSGNRDLFKGLWIDKNTDYLWPVHPVIYLDLSMTNSDTPKTLEDSIMRYLNDITEFYELGEIVKTTPGEMLIKLTTSLFKKFGSKNRVVIIIDEYEKPILNNIDKLKVAQSMRDVLENFYEAIKPLDEYLQFVFITGTTHFAFTSIFSGMNQLDNISMDPKFAHLVGYTKEEINFYFHEHLQKIVNDKKIFAKIGIEGINNKLHTWYNGYRFWDESQEQNGKELARLYTPFSVISFLHKAFFENYWFESGTPSFLIKVLKQNKYPIELFENLVADAHQLMTLDIENIQLAALLFHTGFATIKNYDPVYRRYSLEIPNHEVKDSLLKYVLNVMTAHSTSTIGTESIGLRIALDDGNLESFIDQIKEFYLSIPHTIAVDNEKYYQTIFFLLLQLVNLKPDVEKVTNIGRIDLLVQTSKVLYIFEFKLNGSAQKALQQIFDKKYYEAYQQQGKNIKLVGVNFSSDAKNLTEYLSQDLI